MAVKNLECQLAMAQLRRYLTGAALSDDALEALEQHLAECRDCQLEVAEKRQELAVKNATVQPVHVATQSYAPQATIPTQAVVAIPDNTQVKAKPAKAPAVKESIGMRLIQAGLSQPWIEKIPGGARTFLLSTGLAGLLIAMSALAQNPRAWLGDTAEKAMVESSSKLTSSNSDLAKGTANFELEKYAGTDSPATNVKRTLTDNAVNREPAKSTPTVKASKPVVSKPIIASSSTKAKQKTISKLRATTSVASKRKTSISKARRTVSKPRATAISRTAKKKQSTAKPRPKPNSGVKVYDENGNVIN